MVPIRGSGDKLRQERERVLNSLRDTIHDVPCGALPSEALLQVDCSSLVNATQVALWGKLSRRLPASVGQNEHCPALLQLISTDWVHCCDVLKVS
jgi:hypothetical protein